MDLLEKMITERAMQYQEKKKAKLQAVHDRYDEKDTFLKEIMAEVVEASQHDEYLATLVQSFPLFTDDMTVAASIADNKGAQVLYVVTKSLVDHYQITAKSRYADIQKLAEQSFIVDDKKEIVIACYQEVQKSLQLIEKINRKYELCRKIFFDYLCTIGANGALLELYQNSVVVCNNWQVVMCDKPSSSLPIFCQPLLVTCLEVLLQSYCEDITQYYS